MALLLISLAQPQASFAAAPIIVGDGTAASCTEFSLQNALTTAQLKGGGTIKFRCGADPATILITDQNPLENAPPVTLNIPNNTMIDGESRITLANECCGEFGPTIYVDSAMTAVLKNLTLSFQFNQGRALRNAGTLTIQNVTVVCNIIGSGCIWNDGSLRLQNDSLLQSDPTCCFGNVQVVNTSTGTLVIQDTVFSHSFGFGIENAGTARISNSTFDNLLGWVVINNSGMLAVTGTVFSRFLGYSDGGSTIGNSGTLVLRDSTFSDNSTDRPGGALTNVGDATIDNSRFLRNRSSRWPGGAIFNRGTLTVRTATFIENSSFGPGGALYNTGSSTILSSSFSGNSAKYGGAIANGREDDPSGSGGPENGGEVRIARSIITNNVAAVHGGGIYTYGTGTLNLDPETQVLNNTPDDIFWAPAPTSISTLSSAVTPR